MSLDVYLYEPQADRVELKAASDLCEENGMIEAASVLRSYACKKEITCLYKSNITHNLARVARMADQAGIYRACWLPEEIPAKKAKEIVPILRRGLEDLKARPDHYQRFNSENGWGTYEHFVPWVEAYLKACEENPEAEIDVSR